jgi:hypothetical protein
MFFHKMVQYTGNTYGHYRDKKHLVVVVNIQNINHSDGNKNNQGMIGLNGI